MRRALVAAPVAVALALTASVAAPATADEPVAAITASVTYGPGTSVAAIEARVSEVALEVDGVIEGKEFLAGNAGTTGVTEMYDLPDDVTLDPMSVDEVAPTLLAGGESLDHLRLRSVARPSLDWEDRREFHFRQGGEPESPSYGFPLPGAQVFTGDRDGA